VTDLHTKLPLVTRTVGTGNDLVLLHGWGMNSGAFTSFLPFLSKHCRITTIDLPGYGENAEHSPQPYDADSLAKAIFPYLPKGAVVAGWSLGGLVAQKLALLYPQAVRGIITIASTPRFVSGQNWQGISPDLLSTFESQLEHNYEKTLERFLAIQAMGSETARQDIKAIKQHLIEYPSPCVDALKKGLRILSTEDMRSDIGRISCPTLRLYGRLDSLVPTSGIDRICELQPNADTVVLPHASHAPFISHPQQTSDIVLRFLANLA
jgi:pimeloyl-[acyl-carrier protein] methyl ester esterase